MKSDKDLIDLGHEHVILVKKLKVALTIGQAAFIRAGQILNEIKSKETFLGEDLRHEWTWTDFCQRPDLPLYGSTKESRVRNANVLIRIYKLFVLRLSFPEEDLAPIGVKKLELITAPCEKTSDPEVIEDWLRKAREMTVTDLIFELRGKQYPVVCNHENQIHIWYCPNCGAKSPDKLGSLKK